MSHGVSVKSKYQINFTTHQSAPRTSYIHVCEQEDTVLNFSSIHSSLGVKLQVNELPKSTRVVVVNSLCITKGFHDRAENKKEFSLYAIMHNVQICPCTSQFLRQVRVEISILVRSAISCNLITG